MDDMGGGESLFSGLYTVTSRKKSNITITITIPPHARNGA
jgi:hypothetical protein